MENKEKFDLIKEKLNECADDMPKALSRENIVASLEDVKNERGKTTFTFKRALPLVACFAIVVLSFFAVKGQKLLRPAKAEENTSTAQTVPGDAYDDIIKYFTMLKDRYVNGNSDFDNPFNSGGLSGGTKPIGSDSFTGVYSKDKFDSYGMTNIQVDGVDEADMIKNDGTYIYVLSSSENLYIYRASDLTLVSRIELKKEKDETFDSGEIYLSGSRLVIVTNSKIRQPRETAYMPKESTGFVTASKPMEGGNIYKNSTKSFVYSLDDITSPKLLFMNKQDGRYITSRLVGDTLYAVSCYSVDYRSCDNEELTDICIPKINDNKINRNYIDFSTDSLGSDKGYYTYQWGYIQLGYIVVSACDIAKTEPNGTGYSYLGKVKDVYCTTDALYISAREYLEKADLDKLGIPEYNCSNEYTHIYAVSLSPDEIKFKAETYVPGAFVNQFSMDEYNGYFRCAVNYNDDHNRSTNSIIILDRDFKEVSCLDGLALREEIKSVRFMGDTAYIVTFRNTDPLFVIDLSDPTQPKVDGEVKLPGFSEYLHPIGNDLVIGVGLGGDDTDVDDSLKITLFDVSDKKAPKVISEQRFENTSSKVGRDHREFMYYPEENIFGIPVERRVDYEKDYAIFKSFLLFKAENGELEFIGEYVHRKTMYQNYNYFDDEYDEEYDDEYDYEYEEDEEDYIYDLGYDEDFGRFFELVYDDARDLYMAEYEYMELFDETYTGGGYDFFLGTYIGDKLYTVTSGKMCVFDIPSAKKIDALSFSIVRKIEVNGTYVKGSGENEHLIDVKGFGQIAMRGVADTVSFDGLNGNETIKVTCLCTVFTEPLLMYVYDLEVVE